MQIAQQQPTNWHRRGMLLWVGLSAGMRTSLLYPGIILLQGIHEGLFFDRATKTLNTTSGDTTLWFDAVDPFEVGHED